MLEWEGTCCRFNIAAETVKGYQQHIRILSPEIPERGTQSVGVARINLFP